jgi:hypothetical protein
MNSLATTFAKFIASCVLLVFAAHAVNAQTILPPEDPDDLADLPLVFNMDSEDIDWEGYTMFQFEGSTLERIANPDQSGNNTTAQVLKYVKAGGQPWAGFFYHTEEPMLLTDDSRFRLNIWSPRAGITALLKLEMRQFPDVNTGDIFVNIPVANQWVQLEWDLSTNENWRDTPYDRVVMIMDIQGGSGDGSDPFIWYLDDFAYTATAVSNEDPGEGVRPVSLYQNHPNPVSSSTSIVFTMGAPGHAVVEVFNVLGQRVTTLLNDTLPAGQHETSFNASELPGGTYIYRLQVGDQVQTRKLTVIN